MLSQKFVVKDPVTGLYYTGQTGLGTASQPTFGIVANAVEFDSQEEADAAAASIGGGTVGTTKPR